LSLTPLTNAQFLEQSLSVCHQRAKGKVDKHWDPTASAATKMGAYGCRYLVYTRTVQQTSDVEQLNRDVLLKR